MVFLYALLIFVLSILGDLMATWWTIAANRGLAHRAGAISSLMAVMGAIFILIYIDDPRMLIPEVIGSYIGSWWAVKRSVSGSRTVPPDPKNQPHVL
jgi:hypothetical protein